VVSKKDMRRRILNVVGMLGVVVGLAALIHHVYAVHGTPELRVYLTVDKADYGIPGVTKVYNAGIQNVGRGPAQVTRCNFVSDTATHESSVAYAIQRWDKQSNTWHEFLGSSRKSFCHPYPLGMSQTKLETQWFWPGQVLEMGEEATAARDGLEIGDRVRFVLFLKEPGDYSASMPTQEFVIDEHSTSDIPLRIRE
jgi:hypothetical protein